MIWFHWSIWSLMTRRTWTQMSWGQFHQHAYEKLLLNQMVWCSDKGKTTSSAFYEQRLSQYSFAKKLQSQTIIREGLCKDLSYKKDERKMLMKLTPGLNFINVLHIAFTLVDPRSIKRYWWLNCIFYAFVIYECKRCM